MNIVGGLGAAAVIAAIGLVFSLHVVRQIQQRIKNSELSQVWAGILLRMLTSLAGVVVVFLVFGKEWGLPCALGTVPLYFIELVCGSMFLLRKKNIADVADLESKQ